MTKSYKFIINLIKKDLIEPPKDLWAFIQLVWWFKEYFKRHNN